MLRVALVKQTLDLFGPWSGVKWAQTSPVELFGVWPSKAVYWELTCMLGADWYIVPQCPGGDYTRLAVDSFPGRAEVIRKYTKNVTPVEEVPFHDYDLIISFDAILDIPRDSHYPVFCYYAQEHWDRLYTSSLCRPAKGYDLFLAHMMDSSSTLCKLPQSVSFPYLHDPDLVRSTFRGEKKEVVWAEWRTLMSLGMRDSGDPWSAVGDAAASRLEGVLELPVRYQSRLHGQTYGFADPPLWGDAAVYLRALAECKYFLSVGGRIGGGQGLAEAAAAGCICVGQEDRAYHRLLCHPSCLCADIAEMPTRLKAVRESRGLQEEVLMWQDEKLRSHFQKEPLALLAAAVEMKRAGQSARKRLIG